jgi:hypothetical protein
MAVDRTVVKIQYACNDRTVKGAFILTFWNQRVNLPTITANIDIELKIEIT